MVTEYLAYCRHCGQEMMVLSGVQDPDDELLADMAEEMCDCRGATSARSRKDTESRIQSILGDGAIKRGFNYALPEEVIEYVLMICDGIELQHFDKVTFTEKNGDVIKLVRDGEAVKVRRSTKRQMEL